MQPTPDVLLLMKEPLPAVRFHRSDDPATGKAPYFVGKPDPVMVRAGLNKIGAHPNKLYGWRPHGYGVRVSRLA